LSKGNHEKNQEKKVIEKISKIIDKGTQFEFETEMFPTKKGMDEFEELVKFIQRGIRLLNEFPNTRKKLGIMEKFFQKLLKEKIYDPRFDKLHENAFIMTKKIGRGRELFRNLAKDWESNESPELVDDLCKAYADQYERTCKRYFKPLAEKITKKKQRKCGICIQIISNYDKNTKLVLGTFVPHIRNSIDHKDYFFDYEKKVIVFQDEKKPPLEISVRELKNLIHLSMENEMCISGAENSLKEPLWKAVIVDSRKALKLCKILGANYDKLLTHFIKRGFSIFELTWSLEQLVKQK